MRLCIHDNGAHCIPSTLLLLVVKDISVVWCAIVREQQGLAEEEPVVKGDRKASRASGLTGNGKVPQYLNKVEQTKSSDSK